MYRQLSRRSLLAAGVYSTGALLTGCTKAGNKRINVLYFAGLAEGARLKRNIPAFTKETGIEANFDVLPYDDIRARQIKSFNQKQGDYDVMFVDDIWMYEYVRRGYIRDLTDFVSRDQYEMSDISPKVAAAEGYLDNKVWLIPQRADVQVLFYNKGIFEDAAVRAAARAKTGKELKVPDTWDQYSETAHAIHGVKKNGVELIGCAETLKRPHFAFEFFATRYWSVSGTDFLDSTTGNPLFAGPAGERAISHLSSLKDVWAPGSLLAGHDETISAFSRGNIGLMPQWFAFYAVLRQTTSGLGDALGVALMPGSQNNNSGIRRVPSIGGGSLGIPTNSANPEAAWSFIKYMTSRSIMHDAALNGEIITRRSAYDDPLVQQKIPAVKTYLDSLDLSKFRPRSVAYARIESAIGEGVSRALANEASPSEALADAVQKVVQINQESRG